MAKLARAGQATGVPGDRRGYLVGGGLSFAELAFGVPGDRRGYLVGGGLSFAELAFGVPGEGAAPRPLFRARNKSSLHWIIVNISDGLLEVVFIPHKTIPILSVPEGIERLLPFRSQMLVDPARRELFPCGDDFGDFPSVDRLDQGVNVIGHDNPSEKPVALRVEIQEGGLDDSSRNRITESAASVSGIDPSFEAFAALRVPLRIGRKDDFAAKPLDHIWRNAVGEMISDVLQHAGRIKVR